MITCASESIKMKWGHFSFFFRLGLGWGNLGGMVLDHFQCQGILLIWIMAGLLCLQCGGGGCCLCFRSPYISLIYLPLSGRWPDRLKDGLKEPVNPKRLTNKPYQYARKCGLVWVLQYTHDVMSLFTQCQSHCPSLFMRLYCCYILRSFPAYIRINAKF